MRVHNLASLLLSAAIVACAAGNALAAASTPVEAGKAQVRLLASGAINTESVPVLDGGVEIVLAPGWKTYWRYPGDAGIPPRFDWSGSENVEAVEVFYPAPKRITDGSGQVSIGYENRVVFPLKIRAKDSAKPVVLKLKLDFATCEKICIPAEAILSLDVSANAPAEPALANAAADVPRKQHVGDTSDLSIVAVSLDRGKRPDGKDARVLVTINAPKQVPVDLFAEGPDDTWTLALPERLADTGNYPTFAIPLDGSLNGQAKIPARIRLTLTAGKDAIEVEAPLD